MKRVVVTLVLDFDLETAPKEHMEECVYTTVTEAEMLFDALKEAVIHILKDGMKVPDRVQSITEEMDDVDENPEGLIQVVQDELNATIQYMEFFPKGVGA